MPVEAIQLLVFVVICGVCWYFLGPYVASPFREILIVVVVLVFCLWLLGLFGFPVGFPLRR